MLYKIFEFKKEVGITMKSKETRSQLELIMQLYHAPVSIGYSYLKYISQMYVQIRHSPAHLKDFILTLTGITCVFLYQPGSCICAKEYLLCIYI